MRKSIEFLAGSANIKVEKLETLRNLISAPEEISGPQTKNEKFSIFIFILN